MLVYAGRLAGYLLYALLRQPELRIGLTAEIDTSLANGTPTIDSLYQTELLHHSLLETLRLYPIAAVAPRYAAGRL